MSKHVLSQIYRIISSFGRAIPLKGIGEGFKSLMFMQTQKRKSFSLGNESALTLGSQEN